MRTPFSIQFDSEVLSELKNYAKSQNLSVTRALHEIVCKFLEAKGAVSSEFCAGLPQRFSRGPGRPIGDVVITPEFRVDIGQKIKAMRKAAGLTLLQLGNEFNKSQTWAFQLERGNLKNISVEFIGEVMAAIEGARTARADRAKAAQAEIYRREGVAPPPDGMVDDRLDQDERAPVDRPDSPPASPTKICARCSEVVDLCRCPEGPEAV